MNKNPLDNKKDDLAKNKPINPIKINVINKIYNGKDLTCLQTNDGIWFKGKDIANILGYINTKLAVSDHVDVDDKSLLLKIYQTMNITPPELSYNQKRTMYINESGLSSMISQSKMDEAKNFRKWILNDILPSFKTKDNTLLNENTKPSIYLTKNITDYEDKNVMYIAYVGKHNNELIYKYGISSRMFKREHLEHRKVFKPFVLIYLEETDNNIKIESQFERELKVRDVHRNLSFNGKKYTELFTISPLYNIDKLIGIVDDFIANKPLPAIFDANNKIKLLSDNIEFSKFELEHQYKIKIEDTKQKELDYKMSDNYKMELQIQLLQLQQPK